MHANLQLTCADRIHAERMPNACQATTIPAKSVQCAPVCPATLAIRWHIAPVANVRVTSNAPTIVRVWITRASIRASANAVRMPFARLAVTWPSAGAHKATMATRWYRAVRQGASPLPDTIRKSKRIENGWQLSCTWQGSLAFRFQHLSDFSSAAMCS